MQVWQNSKRIIWIGIRINWQYLGPHLVQPSFCRTFLMVCVEISTSNVLISIFCRSKDKFNKHSQHPLIRRPIIRTFANSNGSLIPFLLFTFKIHPIIRTFAISNKFFGPVGVRINGCLLPYVDKISRGFNFADDENFQFRVDLISRSEEFKYC